MPKLQAMPIKTQKNNFFVKLWLLLTRKRQWQLIEDWHYRLPNNKQLVIPKGFIFDGNSFPMITWFIFSPTGLLLIPVLIHDFCFKYNYLWIVQDHKTYKYKKNNGFIQWNALIRDVGIVRNELAFIDYLVWSISMLFGWRRWYQCRRLVLVDIKPESLIQQEQTINTNTNL